MSDNRKRYRSHGKEGENADKRGRIPARGPSSIESHICDVYDLQKLRYPPPNHIHELSFRKIRVSYAEDFILNRNWPICSLELFELDFQPLSDLPRDLLTFIEDSTTLQEISLDWTDFSDAHWTTIARSIGRNPNIRRCTILNDRAKFSTLEPIFKLPHLREIVLGSFSIDQNELESLLTHPTLSTLHLRRLRINPIISPILASTLASSTSQVSQIIIEDSKDRPTIAEWLKLENSIVHRALRTSITRADHIYIRNAASEDSIRNIIGLYPATGPKSLISVSFDSPLPNGIVAAIPSSNTSNYEFLSSKHSLIVLELPLLEYGSFLSNFIETLMSMVTRALHHLAPNGHLIIIDPLNNNASHSDIPYQSCLEKIHSELIKRVNAFFDTCRVGVWNTSREDQERAFIIGRGDRMPQSMPESSSEPNSLNAASIPLWCWKKVESNLSTEYGRFLLSRVLYDWWGSGLNFNNRREIQAILEQWFMLRANGEDADNYPVDELVKKRVCDAREAEKWVAFLSRRSLIVPSVPSDLIPRIEETDISGVSRLSIGQFEETLQTSRVEALLKAAERHGSSHPIDDLLSMMLRYGTVFGNFRQYSTNDTLFQELVDGGVHCEGFASPFNAQILLSHPPAPQYGDNIVEKKQHWSPTFGSCYEDTDGIFGSIGSFFLLSFFDHDHVFLNPPTVEAVLSRTMHYIHDQMRLRPCTFHVLIPSWDDLEAYQVGIASKYLTRNRSIDSQQFPSQNPYNGERRPSNKKFALLSFSSETRP